MQTPPWTVDELMFFDKNNENKIRMGTCMWRCYADRYLVSQHTVELVVCVSLCTTCFLLLSQWAKGGNALGKSVQKNSCLSVGDISTHMVLKVPEFLCLMVEWNLLLSYSSFIVSACAMPLKVYVKAVFCSDCLVPECSSTCCKMKTFSPSPYELPAAFHSAHI